MAIRSRRRAPLREAFCGAFLASSLFGCSPAFTAESSSAPGGRPGFAGAAGSAGAHDSSAGTGGEPSGIAAAAGFVSEGGSDAGGAGGAGGAGSAGSDLGGSGGIAGGSSQAGTTGIPLATAGAAGSPIVTISPVLDLIDDLEDGDRGIRLVGNPIRDGIWDTGNDGTPGGTETPAPNTFKPIALGSDVPYAGDQYAAHVKGQGFTAYGGYLNVSMRVNAVYANVPQYNASRYSGLSFWAKVGAGSAKAMRLRFVSGDTDPRGGKCKPATDNPPQSELCFNHYFAPVTLSTDWRLYSVDFQKDFIQGADGEVFPTINTAAMYELEFFFAAGMSFELWVDDLSFIEK
jgi:hypothetical protein